MLKPPENYNILYFIKLTSTHQRILVYCANSDDLALICTNNILQTKNKQY